MKGDNELGYIAKADAIRAVIDMLHPYLELEDAAFKVFDAIPTVDYVPMVRCRDCKNAEKTEDDDYWCHIFVIWMTEHDFCSYGERRRGDEK